MPDESQRPKRVIVTDIQMPFWDVVRFLVQWSIAAIPALLILAMIGFIFSAIFAAIFSIHR